jgi:hypothetical protein
MWIVLIVALLVAPAYADEAKPQDDAKWEIHVTGISHHWRNDDDDNDINMGLGLEYRFRSDFGVIGGFFHNSNGNIAEYVLLRYQPLRWGPVHVGAFRRPCFSDTTEDVRTRGHKSGQPRMRLPGSKLW